MKTWLKNRCPDSLSRCATAIVKLEQSAEWLHTEMDLMCAPSECKRFIPRPEYRVVCRAHGFKDLEEFEATVKERGIRLHRSFTELR